mgnify:CR=1 FL=1
MSQQDKYVISISRQLGSGGAYVGKRLAEVLGIKYIDRDILYKAAEELKILEEEQDVYNKEAFWMNLIGGIVYPSTYIGPNYMISIGDRLYDEQARIIRKISKECSCVIVGRCCSHILESQPNHISIFLHADKDLRIKRIESLYNLSEKQARKLVEKNDAERNSYYHTHTGNDWKDATQYHLCLDTGVLGFERAEKIIINYVKTLINKTI